MKKITLLSPIAVLSIFGLVSSPLMMGVPLVHADDYSAPGAVKSDSKKAGKKVHKGTEQAGKKAKKSGKKAAKSTGETTQDAGKKVENVGK